MILNILTLNLIPYQIILIALPLLTLLYLRVMWFASLVLTPTLVALATFIVFLSSDCLFSIASSISINIFPLIRAS